MTVTFNWSFFFFLFSQKSSHVSWLHPLTLVFEFWAVFYEKYIFCELGVYFVKRIECNHNFVNPAFKMLNYYVSVLYRMRSIHCRFKIWIWISGCEVTLFLVFWCTKYIPNMRIYTHVYEYTRRMCSIGAYISQPYIQYTSASVGRSVRALKSD